MVKLPLWVPASHLGVLELNLSSASDPASYSYTWEEADEGQVLGPCGRLA